MAEKWTVWDRLIAGMRYAKVKRLIPPGVVLCDLGCGFEGRFLRTLGNAIAGGYGFDQKVDGIRLGNVILTPVKLQDGIPLGDESVDCVTMLALLEHLDAPAAVMREVFRVLRPDGMVILTTPAPCSKPLLDFLAFRLRVISAEEIADHKHYFSAEEVKELLQATGFIKVRVQPFQFGLNQLAVGTKLSG